MVRTKNHKGFTLLEVVVAIAILAILAGGMMPLFGKIEIGQKTVKVKNELKNIQIAADEYFYENESYPSALADLLQFYLNPGVLDTTSSFSNCDFDAITDDFNKGADYDYCQSLFLLGYPIPKNVTSVGPNGTLEVDYDELGCGYFYAGADDIYVTLQPYVPGYRHTRAKLNIIGRAYAKYLYSTALATMTTTWTGAGGGREDLALGNEFIADGFGVTFLCPNSTTYTFYSTGADQTVNASVTTASIGTGDDMRE